MTSLGSHGNFVQQFGFLNSNHLFQNRNLFVGPRVLNFLPKLKRIRPLFALFITEVTGLRGRRSHSQVRETVFSIFEIKITDPAGSIGFG